MADIWQLILVFSAIAIGWLLGRRGRAVVASDSDTTLQRQYYQGLNYLLDEKPDGALDAFIEALEVNSETLETHIAVGNLMRRKGEVERAIRIHQNLLARPSLPRVHLHQAHLELAKDYISAGLLDRAERLLMDLLIEAPDMREVAMRHLIEIYQDEKEWQKAIDTGRQLLPKKSLLKPTQPADKGVLVSLSHYCCELAQQAMAKNDFRTARSELKQALGYDKNCVRASLLLADVDFHTANYQHAVKVLKSVRDQDAEFLPETIDRLHACYQKLNQPEGFQEFIQESLALYPSARVLLASVEDIQKRQGDAKAAEFIGQELKRHPSLRGLAKLVELNITNSGGRERENLTILQLLIEQLLQSKPHYQCRHCGFSGRSLHWLCPSCKHWGEMKSIRGAEGD